MFRNRHEQQIKEKALILGRFTAGHEQIEILGETDTAHEIGGQIPVPYRDAVRICGRDGGDGCASLPDHHTLGFLIFVV
jgi:hypothetical protein